MEHTAPQSHTGGLDNNVEDYQRLELEAWKLKDPKGFGLQQMRRDSYNINKLARTQVSAAALVLQPDNTADKHAGTSSPDAHDGPLKAGTRPIASAHSTESSGGKLGQPTHTNTGSISDLAYLAKQKLLKGHYNKLFIELCCMIDMGAQ